MAQDESQTDSCDLSPYHCQETNMQSNYHNITLTSIGDN
jgi:hypothetical protein